MATFTTYNFVNVHLQPLAYIAMDLATSYQWEPTL